MAKYVPVFKEQGGGERGYKVTSAYGYRIDPVDGRPGEYTIHSGVDIVRFGLDGIAQLPATIVAIEDGEVVESEYGVRGYDTSVRYPNRGNYVRIRHSSGRHSMYLHLAYDENNHYHHFTVGETVHKGDELGYMGSTGRSTGIHLHFQVYDIDGATIIDPMPFLPDFQGEYISINDTTQNSPVTEELKTLQQQSLEQVDYGDVLNKETGGDLSSPVSDSASPGGSGDLPQSSTGLNQAIYVTPTQRGNSVLPNNIVSKINIYSPLPYTVQYGLASGDIMYVYSEPSSDTRVYSTIEAENLKWFINHNAVKPRFRIYVLFPDDTINYEIPQEDIKLGGDYSENYQNGQRRSLSFVLYNDDNKYTPSINILWTRTRLLLEEGLELPDKTVYWFKKGVYTVTSASPSFTPTGKTVSISAVDKFALFTESSGILTSAYEIKEGEEIESIIHTILNTDMGHGYPFDTQAIIYPEVFKGKKTQQKISKSAGDNYGSILLDLATQLSAEIFYNANGNLTLKPINEVILDIDKPLIYDFDSSKEDLSQLNFTIDYSKIINRIIVIGNTLTGGTFNAVAVNDDPGSPLCYQRVGYRTGQIINDSNIYSMQLAQERADYELRNQLILKSTSSCTVSFNPFLEVNNVIAISDEFYNLKFERFLIQSVSCSLDYSGTTNITFTNLHNLPFEVR